MKKKNQKKGKKGKKYIKKCGWCGQEQIANPCLRNGLDYEPKLPPGYSCVPNPRDWQMSPFSKERMDLNEIQTAERKGYKGRFELARLKKELGFSDGCGYSGFLNEHKEKKKEKSLPVPCTDQLLYQPYGPVLYSSASQNKRENSRVYSYLGPSFYSAFRFKVPAPSTMPITPCSDVDRLFPSRLHKIYVPYGPYGEIRAAEDMYIPMGPSIYPFDLAFN